eukprot:2161858-Pleurochrysis_carterae.AAC.1
MKGRNRGNQRHELERRNAFGFARARRERKGKEEIMTLSRRPWRQTGSAPSRAHARVRAGAWQPQSAACSSCGRAAPAIAAAVCS